MGIPPSTLVIRITFGGDCQNVYDIPSIQSCLNQCATQSRYLRVTWHQDTHACYLKNGITLDKISVGEWARNHITVVPTTAPVKTTAVRIDGPLQIDLSLTHQRPLHRRR